MSKSPTCSVALRSVFLVSLAALFVSFLFAVPALAQSNAELEATIRAAILSDPRSAEMTEAEIDAMVVALVEEAAATGMSSEEISWRPEVPAPWADTADQAPAETCAYSAFLCALNDAFGFSEFPFLIPFMLVITSAILLFVIGSILLHHHGHHAFAGDLRKEA